MKTRTLTELKAELEEVELFIEQAADQGDADLAAHYDDMRNQLVTSIKNNTGRSPLTS